MTDSQPNAADPLLGQVFEGKFEIISVLGQGGMGKVYKARHIEMEKIVAIKTLVFGAVYDDNSYQRFKQEAIAASSLTHRNIIGIYDFGRSSQGFAYLVMEFLSGKTLADIMGDVISPMRFQRIFTQVCDGMQHAHKKGIIHRDLKPSNLMLVDTEDERDVVKIVDFGLAKLNRPELAQQQLTQTGMVMGTPPYMSPEQCRGEALDFRSDIYSLGCVMYASLAGRVPFVGDNSMATIYKHIAEVPAPISQLAPHLGPAIEGVIMRTLEKDPLKRPQSMAELSKELVDAIKVQSLPAQSAVVRTNSPEASVPPSELDDKTRPVTSGAKPNPIPAPGIRTPSPGTPPSFTNPGYGAPAQNLQSTSPEVNAQASNFDDKTRPAQSSLRSSSPAANLTPPSLDETKRSMPADEKPAVIPAPVIPAPSPGSLSGLRNAGSGSSGNMLATSTRITGLDQTQIRPGVSQIGMAVLGIGVLAMGAVILLNHNSTPNQVSQQAQVQQSASQQAISQQSTAAEKSPVSQTASPLQEVPPESKSKNAAADRSISSPEVKIAKEPAKQPAEVIHKFENGEPKKVAIASIKHVGPEKNAGIKQAQIRADDLKLGAIAAYDNEDFVRARDLFRKCLQQERIVYGSDDPHLLPTIAWIIASTRDLDGQAANRNYPVAELDLGLTIFSRAQLKAVVIVQHTKSPVNTWRRLAFGCADMAKASENSAQLTYLRWSEDFYNLTMQAWTGPQDSDYYKMIGNYLAVARKCGDTKRALQLQKILKQSLKQSVHRARQEWRGNKRR